MVNVQEIWKDVPGSGGMYQASNKGRVRSFKRGYRILSQCRVPSQCSGHYLAVSIRIAGMATMQRVHRLVAMAFIPNPENKPQVNHINGDKADNRLENLEWATSKENAMHSFATGLQKEVGRKFSDAEVRRIRTEYASGCKKVPLGRKYGCHGTTIMRIVYRQAYKHVE